VQGACQKKTPTMAGVGERMLHKMFKGIKKREQVVQGGNPSTRRGAVRVLPHVLIALQINILTFVRIDDGNHGFFNRLSSIVHRHGIQVHFLKVYEKWDHPDGSHI